MTESTNIACGCGRTMLKASLAGRDVYRCASCGTRVHLQRVSVDGKQERCLVAGCVITPTTDLPKTRLCAEHFEAMRLEFLPEVYAAYPPVTWLRAIEEYERHYGAVRKLPHSQFDRMFYDPLQPAPAQAHDPLVYFIVWGDRCKIGTTTRLSARVSSLSLPLSAVAMTVPGGPSIERRFHRQFVHQRIGNTEWFQLAGPVADYIASHKAAAA